MRSLTAHLRRPETHDRLPFHPSCPICRATRLHGSIEAGGIVSPRAQALIAATVLAASTGPVPVAWAIDGDGQDPTSAVAPAAPPDSAADPDFDPGGADTDLPD